MLTSKSPGRVVRHSLRQETAVREGAQATHLDLTRLTSLPSRGAHQLYDLPMMTPLDALDIDLLRALHDSPRAGVLELSRSVGVARGTVQARLDRMADSGILTGHGPDLDVAAAGFGVQAFVTLEIAQGALEEVAAELTALPAVLEAYATTGSDVLCRLAASSHEDLQQTLLALNRSPVISRSTSVVVLSVVVPSRALPLLESIPRSAPRRAPAYRDAP
jgi:DNA-binding Lrp family transcriptional regulator